MSYPTEQAKRRFFIYSILLVGIGVGPLLFLAFSVDLAPRTAWVLLGFWALLVFIVAFLQMCALVGWLNPPEQNEKDL